MNKTADHVVNGCTRSDCTLREAVRAANAHPGRDTVVLRSGRTYKLSQAGTGEDAALTGDLDLEGAATVRASGKKKATVDAAGLDRVFQAGAGATTFHRLTITGGTAGGILAAGKISVIGTRLAGNDSVTVESSGSGDLILRGSTVSGTLGGGALLDADGDGDIRVIDSHLRNSGGQGVVGFGKGAISVVDSDLDHIDQAGVIDFDVGGVHISRSSISRTGFEAVSEFSGGGVTISRTKIRHTGGAGVEEFENGSIRVSRSSTRHTGGEGLLEFGDGDVVAGRVAISDASDNGINEFGDGDLRATRVETADTDLEGLLEFNSGSLVADRVEIKDAGDDGVQEYGSGALRFKRSRVSGATLVGVSEPDVGALKISRSTITGAGDSGVQKVDAGQASISRSRIFGNGGGSGGGVQISGGGSAEIDRSTISGNTAAIGGGIYSDSSMLALTRSTVNGNSSSSDGGGLAFNAGSAQLVDSTIAGNKASGSGGGLSVAFAGNIRLNGATVVRNTASFGAANNGFGGGTYGGVSAKNTIIALNKRVGTQMSVDCSQLDSGGHNLISDELGCVGLDGPGDRVRSEPRLGKLRANGGPTKTVALLKHSPAIGKAGGDAPKRDQRGVKREGHGKPDIGAYERR